MTSAHLAEGDIRAAFDTFDADATGSIDRTEMLYALRALGWAGATPSDVAELFAKAGAAEASSLGYDGFAAYVRARQRKAGGPEEIRQAFALFDRAGAGCITREDLRRIGEQVTGQAVPEELLADILRVADKDGDGRVDYFDFRQTVAAPSGTDATLPDSPPATVPPAVPPVGPAVLETGPAADDTTPAAPEADMATVGGIAVRFVDGKVALQDARQALYEFGYDDVTLPADAFAELFADSDADGDGWLTRDEYSLLLVGFGEVVEGY